MCLQAAAGPWAGPAGRGSSHPESPVLLCLTGEGVTGEGSHAGSGTLRALGSVSGAALASQAGPAGPASRSPDPTFQVREESACWPVSLRTEALQAVNTLGQAARDLRPVCARSCSPGNELASSPGWGGAASYK